MRKVTIPLKAVIRWLEGEYGHTMGLHIPVAVDWPELRLTEEQIMANAVAWANNEEAPYPNQQIFLVEVTR